MNKPFEIIYSLLHKFNDDYIMNSDQDKVNIYYYYKNSLKNATSIQLNETVNNTVNHVQPKITDAAKTAQVIGDTTGKVIDAIKPHIL